MASIPCPSCQTVVSGDAQFCGNCGTTIPQQTTQTATKPMLLTCRKCFSPLQQGMKFCQKCGSPAVSLEEEHKRLTTEAEELIKKGGYGRDLEFEEYQSDISIRASDWVRYVTSTVDETQWAEYLYRGLLDVIVVEDAWLREEFCFKTDNPELHEKLFHYTASHQAFAEVIHRGYVTMDLNNPKDYLLTPMMIKLLIAKGYDLKGDDEISVGGFPERPEEFRDKPRPEQKAIRVEAAGTIISFTTHDTVVIVYVDKAFNGKEVQIRFIRKTQAEYKAKVIERTANGTTIFAAIFTIPMVVKEKVWEKRDMVARYKTPFYYSIWDEMRRAAIADPTFAERYYNLSEYRTIPEMSDSYCHTERITLYRGNVTEVDWRGVNLNG